jgi:hypothetical protein
LRLELRGAISRDVDLHLAAFAAKGLRGSAIARVAGVVARAVVLLVAEVVSEFSIQSALDESFGQLLEKSVLTQEVVRLLVVFQQFIKQFGSDRWHNQVSFRDCTVDYRHLHKI